VREGSPTWAKKPSLLTWVTTASKTSPLKGRKTIALNRIGKVANPPPARTQKGQGQRTESERDRARESEE
jgi:hypothetical protein